MSLNTVDISVSWMLDFEATEDLTILLIMKKADSFNLSDQPDRARVFFSAGTRVLLLNKIRHQINMVSKRGNLLSFQSVASPAVYNAMHDAEDTGSQSGLIVIQKYCRVNPTGPLVRARSPHYMQTLSSVCLT